MCPLRAILDVVDKHLPDFFGVVTFGTVYLFCFVHLVHISRGVCSTLNKHIVYTEYNVWTINILGIFS